MISKYEIETCHVVLSHVEIVELFNSNRVQQSDLAFFGEHTGLLRYLSIEEALTALRNEQPCRFDPSREPEIRAGWRQYGDTDLQEDMRYYRDWWREKVEDGRGISVHRGKTQFLLRMALAGLPEWEAIWDMDGGWYQEDAYNAVGSLFGWDPVKGWRDDD